MTNLIVLSVITCAVLAIAYPIVIYPLLVVALARLRPRPWREDESLDLPLAHIITVFNEEKRIRAKLDNAVSLRPPSGGVETIVVSDGSTDGTEAIVREYADRGVRFLACERRGKEFAQLDAIRSTSAPILVFSDASSLLADDCLAALAAPFADPEVASVSGTDRLDTQTSGTGEDLYVRYEMAVRRAECLAGSLVGLSGCLFAVRREICESWLPDVPNDMGSALLTIAAGKRAVAADRALCTYGATHEAGREFRRKRRTALRGLRGLLAYRAAMTRGRWIERWQIFSHKLMRFLAPYFAVLALGTLFVGAAVGLVWAQWLSAAALLGLAGAGLTLGFPGLGTLKPLRAMGFLLLSMTAVGLAWVSVLRRDRAVLWAPTERP